VLETVTRLNLATIVLLNISDITAMTTIADQFVEMASIQVESLMEVTQQLMIILEVSVKMETDIFTMTGVTEIVKLLEVLHFMFEEELLPGQKNTLRIVMTLLIKSMDTDLVKMETMWQMTGAMAQSVKLTLDTNAMKEIVLNGTLVKKFAETAMILENMNVTTATFNQETDVVSFVLLRLDINVIKLEVQELLEMSQRIQQEQQEQSLLMLRTLTFVMKFVEMVRTLEHMNVTMGT